MNDLKGQSVIIEKKDNYNNIRQQIMSNTILKTKLEISN